MRPASSKARWTSPGTETGIQPSSSKRSWKAPARTPSPGAKSLSRARPSIEFTPLLRPAEFGGTSLPPLRRFLGELHEFDLVSVRVPRPRLPVAVATERRLAVYGRVVLPQVLDGRMQIVGQQTDVHKALLPVRIGCRSSWKHLYKTVARDVKVYEHERAVVVVQPESLLDAQHPVEADGLIHVVGREGRVSEVGDHVPASFRCSRRAMSSAKRISESSAGSYPITL